jgi:hypothetical protein
VFGDTVANIERNSNLVRADGPAKIMTHVKPDLKFAEWSAAGGLIIAGLVGGPEEALATRVTEGTEQLGGLGFKSFRALKRALGRLRPNWHYHHIVEQTSENVGRFGATAIHNTANVIEIEAEVHGEISALYSSIRPDITGSSTMTVRQWLAKQPFKAQKEFGQRILQMFKGTR